MSENPEMLDPQQHPVRYILQQLDETGTQPSTMVWRIVQECGAEQALAWLREAQAIEAAGGMLTEDGTRRRTRGGVFFKLVRDRLARGDAQAIRRFRAIFGAPPWRARARRATGDLPPPQPPQPRSPALTWDERAAAWGAPEMKAGAATALKLELTGMPERITDHQRYVTLKMIHRGDLPPAPRAIPVPPQPVETPYVVLINAKHWKGARDRAPDSLCSFSGTGIYDPELGGVTLFAMGPARVRDADTRLVAGAARPPTLTVVGRIGTPLIRPDLTLARMVYTGPLPALPKGLAAPEPLHETPLGLYIGAKAWKQVAAALAEDPADTFISTGTPYYDRDLGMLVVNVTTATTRALDRRQREQDGTAAPKQSGA